MKMKEARIFTIFDGDWVDKVHRRVYEDPCAEAGIMRVVDRAMLPTKAVVMDQLHVDRDKKHS